MVDAVVSAEGSQEKQPSFHTWDDCKQALTPYVNPIYGGPKADDPKVAQFQKLREIVIPGKDPIIAKLIEECDFEGMYGGNGDRIKEYVARMQTYVDGPMFMDDFTDDERNAWRKHMEALYENFNVYYSQDKFKPNAMTGRVFGPLDTLLRYQDRLGIDSIRREYLMRHVFNHAHLVKHEVAHKVVDLFGEEQSIHYYQHYSPAARKNIVGEVTEIAKKGIAALCLPPNATPILATIARPAAQM